MTNNGFETAKKLYLCLERSLDSCVRNISCDQEDECTRYIYQLIEAEQDENFNKSREQIYDVFGIMARFMYKAQFYVRLYNGEKKTPVITDGYKIFAFGSKEFIDNNKYVDTSLPEDAVWCQMSGKELMDYVTLDEDENGIGVYIDTGHDGIYFDFETAKYLLMGDMNGYMPCEDIFHNECLKNAS